ncbi:MAG: oligosaccharide flippase family protein [Armatimonadetes bacterium]|nr:oligosaccharide flippase family protein [Armatimonadota bacterium]MDE2207619.1 oligosaccharide flippase family protein [Armatimonadota bacterium]
MPITDKAANRSRAAGIAYLIFQPLTLNALSIPATAFIIRQLGPLGYGQWAVAYSLVATVGFLTNLGLRTLFVRSAAQDPARLPELLGEQIGLRLILGAGAVLLCLSACVALRYPLVIVDCALLSCGSMMVYVVATCFMDALQSLDRIREFSTAGFIAGILVTVVTVAVAARGGGPVALSAAYLTSPVVNLLALWRVVRRHIGPIHIRWRVARFKALMSESRTLIWQGCLGAIQDRSEQLVLPKLAGVTAFGYYAAGALPSDRLGVIPDGLETAFYPGIARAAASSKDGALKQTRNLLAVSLVTCVPIALLGFFLAKPMAVILFRTHWQPCATVIRITIWSLPLIGLSKSMRCGLNAVHAHDAGARAAAWATVTGGCIAIMLMAVFGITGAAVGMVVRTALAVLFLSAPFHRNFAGTLRQLPLVRIAICSGVMAAVLHLATRSTLPALEALLAAGVVSTLAYVASLLLLRIVEIPALLDLMRPASAE